MFKSKILTIFFILCFLSVNGNVTAAESNSEEAETKPTTESNVKNTSETVSGYDEKKPSSDETEDEEPDCD